MSIYIYVYLYVFVYVYIYRHTYIEYDFFVGPTASPNSKSRRLRVVTCVAACDDKLPFSVIITRFNRRDVTNWAQSR